jgi:hypothetical protein
MVLLYQYVDSVDDVATDFEAQGGIAVGLDHPDKGRRTGGVGLKIN